MLNWLRRRKKEDPVLQEITRAKASIEQLRKDLTEIDKCNREVVGKIGKKYGSYVKPDGDKGDFVR